MYVSRPLLHILNASCNSPLVKLHAIHRSGDLLGHAGENSCRHTIHVDMKRLPKDMKCMYIMVLSAFAGALMHNILFPSVNLFDSSDRQNATQICSYELEDKKPGQKVSVLMCRVVRSLPSSSL